MKFQSLKIEGALLSADLVSEIASGEAFGQRPQDFGLNTKIRLIDEIAACWSDARAYWEAFQHGLGRVKESETAATVTREQWILPLLRSLGFDGITFSRSATHVGGQSYFISHRLGDDENGLPIHIEGAKIDLDKRPPSGRPRISPHALLQEYLNRTDHLWGIVTNGYQFRILRDSERLSRPTYIEFDLQQIMEAELFVEFQLFYRLVHRSRWPENIETAHECLLEQYYQQGIEAGGRVRDRLRDGVEEAIKIFGNGFLSHPDNDALRNRIREHKLNASQYYRQLLRLVYRFLFLMVSEERNLVGPDPENDHLYKIYSKYYSISRLRDKVEHPFNPEDHYEDIWEGVKQTFRLYADKHYGRKLKISPLNGDLFSSYAMPDLEKASLYNHDFLRGFAHLSIFKTDTTYLRINYAHLDIEELGSVYESLLDYHPIFKEDNGRIKFELAYGTERKSTGSYYTRSELVQELIKTALVPVIEERLNSAKTKEEKEKALLSLKICDPAAGSGHFLLAAARRIGKELAKVRTGEEQPTPTEFRRAVRDVIQHCIYGVDLNPLAVDLCKVALWIEGHNRGYPLTFLDHRIKCGNSLVGLDRMDRLAEGIPDDAFNPATGDNREVAKTVKAINRRERKEQEMGQEKLPFDIKGELQSELKDFAEKMRSLEEIPETTPEEVNRKQKIYQRFRTEPSWWKDWTAANIWTSAFFYPLTKTDDPAIPTHGKLLQFMERPKAVHGQLVGRANALSTKHKFFHWPIEFPEVFDSGGFDVVLGNPPWEKIKLQEKEFFATRSPEIAQAPNKAAREKLIKKLQETNPALYMEFIEAKHTAEATSIFIRAGNRFPLTATGDINTYALFAELAKNLINRKGRAGIIVPTGIATDDTYKRFFAELTENKSLVSLYDFENREKLFQAVDSRYKFSLVTMSAKPAENTEFAFFLTRIEHFDNKMRRFHLSSEDIELINPNTKTVPVFRTRVDAELTRKIYRNVPVLINEKTGENPWGIKFTTMFHMANDSHLFRTREQLEAEGYRLKGNRFVKDNDMWLPLYEAKMIWQYDHRFGTYEGVRNRTNTHLPTPSPKKHADPSYTVQPWYWVSYEEVHSRIKDAYENAFGEITEKYPRWLIGFRNVTNATNERSAIFTILPPLGVGHSIPLVLIEKPNNFILLLIANLSNIIFDFIVRQKIGGINFTFFIVKQLPVIPPDRYSKVDIEFITPRALELIYTSWDLKPFAEDMGYDGPPFRWDEERRALLRAELDAYYAKLYGLTRKQLRYILDPADLTKRELEDILDPWEEVKDPLDPKGYEERVQSSTFPGETFRVLKEKEIRQFGEYRTRRLVLEAWERIFASEWEPVKTSVKIVPQQVRHRGFDRYNQAAVLSLVVYMLDRSDIGRVGHDKVLYFVQEHLGLDLGLKFERRAAGPWGSRLKTQSGVAN